MRTNVRFKTDRLKKPDNKEDVFSGEELAKWLVEKINTDFELDYIDEDYYCILWLGNPENQKIEGGCGHVEKNKWQVFMKLKPSLFDRLLKRPMPNELLRSFLLELDHFLHNDSEISDIEWYEEGPQLQELNYGKHPI